MLSLYIKPVLKGFKGDVAKALLGRLKYNLARLGKSFIKDAIKDSFKGKGNRVRQGVSYTIGKSSVTFYLNQIGFFHNYGVVRHKMKYLQKSKRPIPIQLKSGETIFRWASAKSMKKKNSWIHPGIKPKNFLESGVDQLKKEFRNRLKKEAVKYLRGKR